ncbi:MAG: tetratricopeptide repeat protein [Bacteroidota bacterium]|nr:tetratricopeptide repeat protein [Bacteroidota bacterium]
MRRGPIILLVASVALALGLYFAPRTPDQSKGSLATEEAVDAKAEKVRQAAAIIENGDRPPMEAITLLREVLEEDPDYVPALLKMGEFSLLSGQFDKARDRFEHAVEVEPGSFPAVAGLAQALLSLGDQEGASTALQQFIEQHPNHPDLESAREMLNTINGN